MPPRKPDLLDALSSRISDLYVAIEDLREDTSGESRLKVLRLIGDVREAMDVAEQSLNAPPVTGSDKPFLRSYAGPLKVGDVYTRNDLRELFEIRDAALNNGVFHFKERREVWLFVTENKSTDREQYVDKLTGDVLCWQGQRRGRTDRLIINHVRNGDLLLLFYRMTKNQFEGAGFIFDGPFLYVSHSGGLPTSFVLHRQTTG